MSIRLKQKIFFLNRVTGEEFRDMVDPKTGKVIKTSAQQAKEQALKITGKKSIKDMGLKTSDAITYNRESKAKIDAAKAEISKRNQSYAQFRGDISGMKGIQRAQGGSAHKVWNLGRKTGANSVGFKQDLKNSWSRMGTMGKAGVIGAGVVGAGLMAKGLFGGKKKDQ